MNISIRSLAFTLLLALGIASCKSDSPSEPGGGNNNTGSVKAKAGSTYTYDSTSSSGGSTGSITYTISHDNITADGRSGIRLVMQEADSAFMFTYNADGSISMYFPTGIEDMGGDAGIWLKLPVNGGAGESVVVIDTTIDDPELPFPITMKLTMTTSSAGATNLMVGGKSYAAHNANMVMDLESNFLGNITGTTTITWIPEIGFYGKMVSNTSALGSTETNTETLTSFNLVK